MKVNRINLENILVFFYSLFITLFPWEKFRAYTYVDRENNYNYITYHTNKIEWFDYSSFSSLITYEWLWHYLLNLLSNILHLNATTIFFFITFFVVYTFSKTLQLNLGFIYILLIINPSFIDFSQSQLRLAFAMSIICMSYLLFNKNNNKIYFLPILITPFIHTSTIIFLSFALVSYLVGLLKDKIALKLLLLSVYGFLVAFTLGPLRTLILGYFDDRRAEYGDMSSPLISLLFWILTYFIIVFDVIRKKSRISFELGICIIVLSLVFANILFHGYSSRFIAATFPFILIGMVKLSQPLKQILLLGYLLFTTFLWVFWIY